MATALNAKVVDALRRLFSRRQHAYRRLFTGPHAHVVLQDLARFCRARETTFNVDPRAHALAEGRREVWLRIQDHLKLNEDELWAAIMGRPQLPETIRDRLAAGDSAEGED